MLSATKQRRQVDALLKIKEQYISEEKIAAEWKSIDYLSFMPYFADFFASDDESAYR